MCVFFFFSRFRIFSSKIFDIEMIKNMNKHSEIHVNNSRVFFFFKKDGEKHEFIIIRHI